MLCCVFLYLVQSAAIAYILRCGMFYEVFFTHKEDK